MSRAGTGAVVGVVVASVAFLALLALNVVEVGAQLPPTPLTTTTTIDNGPRDFTFVRSPERGLPGTVIGLTGTGCRDRNDPYREVFVELRSRAGRRTEPDFIAGFGPFRTSPDGSWEGVGVVPAKAPLGEYDLEYACPFQDTVEIVGSLPFTVGPPLSPPTTIIGTVPSPTTASAAVKPAAKIRVRVITTTTVTAMPVSTGGPVADGGRNEGVAAPVLAVPSDHRRPWGIAALAAILAVATGGSALVATRRRRR